MLVVKIGGSAISDKSKKYSFSLERAKNIAKELKKFHTTANEQFILVLGAGSIGHTLVDDFSLLKKLLPTTNAECSARFDQYIDNVRDVLLASGLPVITFRSSALFYKNKNRIYANENIIKCCLKTRMVPLISADFCVDMDKKWSMMSGDDITVFLAKRLKARKVIMVSDTKVKTKEGYLDKLDKSTPMKKIEEYEKNNENKKYSRKYAKRYAKLKEIKKRIDVSGGIKRKIRLLLNLADRGVPSVIVDATKKNELLGALQGEKVGTKVIKKRKTIEDLRNKSKK